VVVCPPGRVFFPKKAVVQAWALSIFLWIPVDSEILDEERLNIHAQYRVVKIMGLKHGI
jgi:hypothetical protein